MQAEQLKELVVGALEDVKAQDVSIIDVRGRTSVTDYMVLASGTSNRHVKSLADSVLSEARDQASEPTTWKVPTPATGFWLTLVMLWSMS